MRICIYIYIHAHIHCVVPAPQEIRYGSCFLMVEPTNNLASFVSGAIYTTEGQYHLRLYEL